MPRAICVAHCPHYGLRPSIAGEWHAPDCWNAHGGIPFERGTREVTYDECRDLMTSLDFLSPDRVDGVHLRKGQVGLIRIGDGRYQDVILKAD